jgi:DNA-binding FadR family transcriptional regulator
MSVRPGAPSEGPAAGEIAEELRRRVHRGELGPGDRLPAERELAEQLGVPRQWVREAFGLLEREGYLVVRRGATGGRFVTELRRPQRRWVDRMRRNAAGMDALLDYRIAVERQLALLAAERRTVDDLRSMRRAIAQLEASETPHAYRQADSAFHAAVAAAARSPRLAEAVERARGELFQPVDELWLDERAGESVVHHRRITDAIEAGDAEGAAAAMVAHLEDTRREVHQLLER